ncbi:CHAT domain-containing protein [Roseomonas xinghualingensis]|uniref:CHAT domain-containing protein n=1 Tax=Roseomonas xinghualingensis TaxID=2986475 RepID=UPI0021F0F7BC|nr:CHAT domain-containing protein [Roseomonas sp. SXEYE001]MCV4208207.1 CHAT domain-containing protein [Roseomonas sp. SXEYE001]
MNGIYRQWRDLAELAGIVEALMERRFPGELLCLRLEWSGRKIRVEGEIASETARSTLLRHLSAIPGTPTLIDELTVTGFFEPATNDDWFLRRQPTGATESDSVAQGERDHERGKEAIVRHPSLQPEGRLAAGATIGVIVDLTEAAETFGSPALQLARLAPGWGQLDVDVLITSRAFVHPLRGSIRVLEEGGSRPARLPAVLRDDLTSGAAIEVSLMFFEEQRFCGSWDTRLGVVAGESGVDPSLAAPRKPIISIASSAGKPDLTIVIRSLGGERLDWNWQLPRGIELGLGSIAGSVQVADPRGYARELLRACPLMPGAAVKRRMVSIGEDIWLKTPQEFRTTYAALRERLGPNFSIQLLLDEHSIPWEMMVPDVEGAEALYLTHPIARWPVANGADMPWTLPTGAICSFVPQYRDNRTLPAALLEGEWLENSLGALRRKASVDGFLSLMGCTDAPGPVSMVHFAGHGRAANEDGGAGLLMEDDWVIASDLNSKSASLGMRDRSMVVLNACEMADVGSELGWVSGWAPLLVRHRFGAVIAPLWRVQDNAAHEVIVSGLHRMYRAGYGIGAAFAAARAERASDSAAAYAFITYGDVMATIGRYAVTIAAASGTSASTCVKTSV